MTVTQLLDDATQKKVNELRDALTRHTLKVVFEKKDGTERTMYCTLNPEHLPEKDETKQGALRKYAPDVIPVLDVELGEWRSFRVGSVRSVELQL
jgi:hypothetical protein